MTPTDLRVERLWKAIGTYSVQCSETKELAPSRELVEAVTALSEALGEPVAFISERNLKALAAGEHSKVWPPSQQEPGETALYASSQRAEPASVQEPSLYAKAAAELPDHAIAAAFRDAAGCNYGANHASLLVSHVIEKAAALAAHPSTDQNHSG